VSYRHHVYRGRHGRYPHSRALIFRHARKHGVSVYAPRRRRSTTTTTRRRLPDSRRNFRRPRRGNLAVRRRTTFGSRPSRTITRGRIRFSRSGAITGRGIRSSRRTLSRRSPSTITGGVRTFRNYTPWFSGSVPSRRRSSFSAPRIGSFRPAVRSRAVRAPRSRSSGVRSIGRTRRRSRAVQPKRQGAPANRSAASVLQGTSRACGCGAA
jgi:hypothetical protein